MSPKRDRWEARRAAEIATRRAVLARDAGLQRISRVTRWMVAGVVGLSGGFALLAAGAFHGRTIATPPASGASGTTTTPATTTPSTTPATTTPATTTPSTTTPATTTPSQGGGLQPPSQAPTPAPAPAPVVVSGGS